MASNSKSTMESLKSPNQDQDFLTSELPHLSCQPMLNSSASKYKAELAQKGSLAQRRRPVSRPELWDSLYTSVIVSNLFKNDEQPATKVSSLPPDKMEITSTNDDDFMKDERSEGMRMYMEAHQESSTSPSEQEKHPLIKQLGVKLPMLGQISSVKLKKTGKLDQLNSNDPQEPNKPADEPDNKPTTAAILRPDLKPVKRPREAPTPQKQSDATDELQAILSKRSSLMEVDVNNDKLSPKHYNLLSPELVKPTEHIKSHKHVKSAENVKSPERRKPTEHVKSPEHVKSAEHITSPKHAKSHIHVKSSEHDKATEHMKSLEHVKYAETVKPLECDKSTEIPKHTKSAEHTKSNELITSTDDIKSIEQAMPSDHVTSIELMKPLEHVKSPEGPEHVLSSEQSLEHAKSLEHIKSVEHIKSPEHSKSPERVKSFEQMKSRIAQAIEQPSPQPAVVSVTDEPHKEDQKEKSLIEVKNSTESGSLDQHTQPLEGSHKILDSDVERTDSIRTEKETITEKMMRIESFDSPSQDPIVSCAASLLSTDGAKLHSAALYEAIKMQMSDTLGFAQHSSQLCRISSSTPVNQPMKTSLLKIVSAEQFKPPGLNYSETEKARMEYEDLRAGDLLGFDDSAHESHLPQSSGVAADTNKTYETFSPATELFVTDDKLGNLEQVGFDNVKSNLALSSEAVSKYDVEFCTPNIYRGSALPNKEMIFDDIKTDVVDESGGKVIEDKYAIKSKESLKESQTNDNLHEFPRISKEEIKNLKAQIPEHLQVENERSNIELLHAPAGIQSREKSSNDSGNKTFSASNSGEFSSLDLGSICEASPTIEEMSLSIIAKDELNECGGNLSLSLDDIVSNNSRNALHNLQIARNQNNVNKPEFVCLQGVTTDFSAVDESSEENESSIKGLASVVKSDEAKVSEHVVVINDEHIKEEPLVAKLCEEKVECKELKESNLTTKDHNVLPSFYFELNSDKKTVEDMCITPHISKRNEGRESTNTKGSSLTESDSDMFYYDASPVFYQGKDSKTDSTKSMKNVPSEDSLVVSDVEITSKGSTGEEVYYEIENDNIEPVNVESAKIEKSANIEMPAKVNVPNVKMFYFEGPEDRKTKDTEKIGASALSLGKSMKDESEMLVEKKVSVQSNVEINSEGSEKCDIKESKKLQEATVSVNKDAGERSEDLKIIMIQPNVEIKTKSIKGVDKSSKVDNFAIDPQGDKAKQETSAEFFTAKIKEETQETAKVETKAETKETKTETKKESKTETKVETKSKTKAENRAETEPIIMIEPNITVASKTVSPAKLDSNARSLNSQSNDSRIKAESKTKQDGVVNSTPPLSSSSSSIPVVSIPLQRSMSEQKEKFNSSRRSLGADAMKLSISPLRNLTMSEEEKTEWKKEFNKKSHARKVSSTSQEILAGRKFLTIASTAGCFTLPKLRPVKPDQQMMEEEEEEVEEMKEAPWLREWEERKRRRSMAESLKT